MKQSETGPGAVAASRRRVRRRALAMLAIASLAGIALVAQALASAEHPFVGSESLTGFNHACGVATDTQGDVYAASAGETPSKIKIFNPSHTEIGSIVEGLAGAEPCGLAVDAKGNLYVTEKAVGKVVRYHPTTYPFVGSPSYAPLEEIDKSGNAKGIATDPFESEDRLYVAEGNHIAVYNPSGALGENEQQKVAIRVATGGSFRLALAGDGNSGRNEVQLVHAGGSTGSFIKLSFEGQTTGWGGEGKVPPTSTTISEVSTTGGTLVAGEVIQGEGIEPNTRVASCSPSCASPTSVTLSKATKSTAPNAKVSLEANVYVLGSGAEVQTALEALSTIGAGNISCGSGGSESWWCEFIGALAKKNVPPIGGTTATGQGEVTDRALSDITPAAGLPRNATPTEVQTALEGLEAIGAGNVSVSGASGGPWTAEFVGALARTSVESLSGDPAALTPNGEIAVSEPARPFSGVIGEGTLSEAGGVAAYTYMNAGKERYLFAADPATNKVYVFRGADVRKLTLDYTIDGSEAPGFTLGPGDAYLAADPTSGHLLLYDHAANAVDELEATGRFVTQVSNPALADAQPTAIAVYPQWHETQRVEVSAGSGGFKLCFPPAGEPGSECTAAIAYNAKAEAVQEALEALASVGPGNVSVASEDFEGKAPFRVSFVGALDNRDVEQMSADSSGLSGGAATATVTTERQGSGPGHLYVGSGDAAGAQVLTFGPLAAPTLAPLPRMTIPFKGVCGVVTDSYGDVYAAGESKIEVYPPEPVFDAEGKPIPIPVKDSEGHVGKIEDKAKPCELAVDSAGNLYASDGGVEGSGTRQVSVFKPGSFPPTASTTYGAAKTIVGPYSGQRKIAVDPADDHLLVAQETKIEEYGSAAAGSPLLEPELGKGLGPTYAAGVDVCAKTGWIYAAGRASNGSGGISVLSPAGAELLAQIDGFGSPLGRFGGGSLVSNVAVDQSDCHVLLGEASTRGAIEEYEPSGTFVAQAEPEGGFANFGGGNWPADIAVDNGSHSPDQGNVYVALKEKVYGFKRFEGAPPLAATGPAGEASGGAATLTGTVNPRGTELSECLFEYGETEAYGKVAACEEPDAAELGAGKEAVPVHARIASGLDPAKRYHFRLVARNGNGTSAGEDEHFGPPLLSEESARPVRYTEATVNATIDPSGLKTSYRVEYGETASYGHSSPGEKPLAATAGPTGVHVSLFGLAEGAEYHYRLVAENEAMSVAGLDRTFVTEARPEPQACPNDGFRTGFSAGLPDCRAYELTTPAETQGANLFSFGVGSAFNNWRVTPRGEGAGERIAFDTNETLPGFGFGSAGRGDNFVAVRGQAGWTASLLSPPFAQGGSNPDDRGSSPDQGYELLDVESSEGSLPAGQYLRTPGDVSAGPNCLPEPGQLERLGCGSLGFELGAGPRFLSLGAAHVIFTTGTCGGCTAVRLEPDAPPSGIEAIYDRTPGGPTHVVSLPPAGASAEVVHEFETKNAEYLGTSEDGSSVAFKLGEALYVRRNDAETLEIAAGPSVFAGLSADGKRIFYARAGSVVQADLFACNLEAGPCAGPAQAQEPIEIALASIFVNVSADGSHVYFTSKEALTGEGEKNGNGEFAKSGEDNLYLCDLESGPCAGPGAHPPAFIAILDPQDLVRFGPSVFPWNLAGWVEGVNPPASNQNGINIDPSRSTPDGRFLVFQSHARLTSYDNTEASAAACGNPEKSGERCGEVYRYDSAGGSLTCVSCDPSGAPPSAEAELWEGTGISPADSQTRIPNVTDNGQAVFFETPARLLPEDKNSANDVYEWEAKGAGSCRSERQDGGCLFLISSGQGESDSFLYGMTADGHDVFIWTLEPLLPSDASGGVSIYDARIGGGFPEAEAQQPCEGDACQGQGAVPPEAFSPASAIFSVQAPPSSAPPAKAVKPLTRAQKLARALKACRKKRDRRKRAACERQARKRYPAKRSRKAAGGRSGR